MNRGLHHIVSRLGAVVAGTAVTLAVALAGAPAANAFTAPTCHVCGTGMVFLRTVNGHDQVFKASQDLSVITQLTTTAVDKATPTINASRTVIAFTSFVGNQSQLWAMNTDGSNLRNVTNDPNHGYLSPSLSPDGTKAVVATDLGGGFEPELAMVNMSTGAGGLLTAPGTPSGDPDGINWAPTWSPNGQSIAFISDRSGVPNVWVMSAAGGSARQVTFNPFSANTSDPAWSPSGDTIAFAYRPAGEQQAAIAYVKAFQTSPVVRVTPADGTPHADPSWSPDGTSIAYSDGAVISFASLNATAPHAPINPGFAPDLGSGMAPGTSA